MKTLRKVLVLAASMILAMSMAGTSAGVALVADGGSGSREAGSAGVDYYINYVAPRVERQSDGPEVAGAGGVMQPATNFGSALEQALAIDAKFAGGNPRDAKQLAKAEARALKENKNPREFKQAEGQQEAQLLTILVEFNAAANDDFTGTMVPETVFESRTCVPGTVQNGPLHNNIPNPANASHPDNNTMWVPDFSPEHFNNMLYTSTGITDRVRTDLTGPDGEDGFDISGFTMKNMYEEMSKGAYTVDGAATPWVTVPHSEAWYGASTCDAAGTAPIPQAMNGHPDNPGGPGTLAIDAINALAAADPAFPWADYDVEDQGDIDGDENVLEPDGVVDHLVLVHAGEDKSGGGGAQGVYAIWAHSSAVPGGYTVPGTDIAISNYIVQPEDSGVGVFAHEYGHDLGLPDLYDTSGAADSDVDFWDLMASGSHSGPIFQSMPAHMGIWDKWVLGWANPRIFVPGDSPATVELGQTSRTPTGTEDGIRIILPPKVITTAVPHSGEAMWFGGNDQDWADVKLARTIDVPASADARFTLWNNFVIEEDWDFGFIEVSVDNGTTWTEQKIYTGADVEVSTPEPCEDPPVQPCYSDPNGRMHDYGAPGPARKYGLTGSSDGWREDYVKLGAFAGTTIQLRLRYATDAGFLERGWFADDFSVTDGASAVWTDDAETDGDWVAELGTFTNTAGAGWHRDSGTAVRSHYYLAEWRNFDGFDAGLQYAYDTTYSHDAWLVEKIRYNAPGMLVWYRDTTWGNVNHVTSTTTALPSTGSKGGLLLVDSHFDPLRREGLAADKDPSTLNNLPSRPQSSNAAFTEQQQRTYPFRECFELLPAEPFSSYCTDFKSLQGVSVFTDAQGWYPGIEVRGQSLFFRDIDASTVIPSVDNSPYSTRVVNDKGRLLNQLYGLDIGLGSLLGSGNPGDEGVALGVRIEIQKAAKDNMSATVNVTPVQ